MRFFRLHPSEALLRVGLAFAFIYPAVSALLDPAPWLGYIPPVALQLFHSVSIPLSLSDVFLLHAFGLVEIALALIVVLARNVRIPSFIMAFILILIVLTNLDVSTFSVLFRDISIACAALSLGMMHSRT